MFSEMVKEGINKIYTEDLESQRNFIRDIAEVAREMEPDILFDFDAFFVPNNEYMSVMFSPLIRGFKYDCYTSEGACLWIGHLVFPIYDVLNEPVGFVGFSPINKLKSKEDAEFKGIRVYRDSNKSVFEKSRYLFALKGVYERALEEGYIILTDGVFDTISLTQNNLVAGAFLGSYVSDELIAFLKFVPRVYISRDNDETGVKLSMNLRRKLPQLREIRQNAFKDMDELLKSKHKEDFLKKFEQHRKMKTSFDFIYRAKGEN